jgi:hypothetical protein
VADIKRMRVDVTGAVSGDVLAYDGVDAWLPVAASGGSDPWTTVKLASDFASTTITQVAVTGWTFTPAANKTYEFQVRALGVPGSAITGLRPGYLGGMGGTIACGAEVLAPTAANATTLRNLFGTNLQASSSAQPVAVEPHLIQINGLIISGATPSGSLEIGLATETATIPATFKAGSFFRYREV